MTFKKWVTSTIGGGFLMGWGIASIIQGENAWIAGIGVSVFLIQNALRKGIKERVK